MKCLLFNRGYELTLSGLLGVSLFGISTIAPIALTGQGQGQTSRAVHARTQNKDMIKERRNTARNI
jgi:hypothetical protein